MRRLAALLLLPAIACGGDPLAPAPLDTRNETCASCRMTVSDARFAAQLVAPGEEPRFFDDVGCLGTYLRARPAKGVAYVADHRTKAWVKAAAAVYTRVSGETPMASHVLAHGDAASRDQDREARGGSDVSASEILGAEGGRR
jgi:copper chaperone NosL